jgi:hypothetical protein
MRCYFKLVSSDQNITDEEGLEVADVEEAQALAREAITEMVQEAVAEIARWRGWALEARDASGTVLFTVGFEAVPGAEGRTAEAQAVAETPTKEDGTYAYDKAA